MRVEVEDGRAVVHHHADRAEAALLQADAARLEAAAHPGVVVVLRSGPTRDGGWELVIEHGGTPLSALRMPRERVLAAVAAEVASTLTELHDRGLVHGRLEGRVVLVGPDGRAVLTGFGASAPDGSGPSDDVAALGRLLLDRLDATAASGGLVALATTAVDPDGARRPGARRLAQQLHALATDRTTTRPVAPRRRLALTAVVVVAGTVALGLALRPGGSDRAVRAATTSTSASRQGCIARAGTPLRAIDCGHDVMVDGSIVTIDGHVHVVGLEGDEVAVAAWGCAAEPQAAVLRPATGQLLVMAGLDGVGAPTVVRADQVAPHRRLAPRLDSHGCASLHLH